MKQTQSLFTRFLFAVSFFFTCTVFVSAQTLPPPQEPQLTLVATVNVQDISLIKQEGNTFTIAFNISNREGAQPKVIYAVNLIQQDSKGNFNIVDQKIYDNDTLSLSANDSVHKEIIYTAPSYLNGSYTIDVMARNHDGLILGENGISTPITLNGTNEYINIDQSSCFLIVEGEKGNIRYTLDQGVDISKDETLIAQCSIKNTFKTVKTIVPVFETRYRSTFGKVINTEKQNPIILSAGKTLDFTAKLPKLSDPQAYDAILTFVNEKNEQISSPVDFHYVLQGESATIQNLTFDKDAYQKGDMAKMIFFWSGTASNFPGAREKVADISAKLYATFTMTDDKGNSCSDTLVKAVNAEQQGGVEHLDFSITTKLCQNPTVHATITNKEGKILAGNTYTVKTKNPSREIAQEAMSTEPESGISSLVIYGSVILFLIVAFALYIIKKNRHVGTMILFGILVGVGAFADVSPALADTLVITFYPHSGTIVRTTMVVNIDKSDYDPEETITARGRYISTACSNGVNVDVRGIDLSYAMSATINSVTKSVLPRAYYSAQSVPGTYFANFNVSVSFGGVSGSALWRIPYNVIPGEISGGWGVWSPWSNCSSSCGGGIQYQTRPCNNPPPSNSGEYCSGSAISSQSCNTQVCPSSAGACGSATRRGTAFNPPKPPLLLCSQGIATPVIKNMTLKQWEWTCLGNFGDNQNCTAPVLDLKYNQF